MGKLSVKAEMNNASRKKKIYIYKNKRKLSRLTSAISVYTRTYTEKKKVIKKKKAKKKKERKKEKILRQRN